MVPVTYELMCFAHQHILRYCSTKEPLVKSKKYERRADKRSASADNSGGCATPKVEFWHPIRLNQSTKVLCDFHSLFVFHGSMRNSGISIIFF